MNYKKLSITLIITLLLFLFSGSVLTANLETHYLDVGQGDAILIQTPEDHFILIDGGPQSAGDKIVSYLNNQKIETLDYIVSTPPHADHIGGLITILDHFEVNKIIDSSKVHTSQTYEDYLTQIDQKDISYQQGRTGDSFSLGEVDFKILHPDQVENYDLNNSSLVLHMEYKRMKFLFTGDVEEKAEAVILNSEENIEADFLKVAHHGSRSSTSSQFLSEVSPQLAIIMCGQDNRYDHPHEETLQKLSEAEVELYRTDQHGTIILSTDGKEYNVTAEYEPDTSVDTDSKDSITEDGSEEKDQFVGSTESDKYHYPDCRWAENIDSENEIWFDSAKEAQKEGYKPCGTCKPPE